MAIGRALKRHTTSEISIFGRLIKADKSDLSHDLSRYILNLGFDDEDQKRMSNLAERNQEGTLSGERRPFESFLKAGHLLALLHSKVRRTLKSKRVPRGRHGRIART
jgi:hypothetical protein